MTKIFKIVVIFILTISIFVSISNAETTNLYNDVSNSSSNTSTNENTVDDDLEPFEDNDEEVSNTAARASTAVNAQINTVSSIPEANLGLNNILCIILIAIGILIILLAIAILIRTK